MKGIRLGHLIVALIVVAGCATVQPPSKGAVVKVYKPNPIKEGVVCTTLGKEGIAFMYVGKETVSGKVSDQEKPVIAQYAKAVLGQTRFINPVSAGAMEGEYADLSISVHTFTVKETRKDDRVSRDGTFHASFTIRQAGEIDCATANPILIEKHYEFPVYKKDQLPSEAKIKEEIVKAAVNRVVAQFVPVTSSVLRPVKFDGDQSTKVGQMIDGGNCQGAYEMVRATVEGPRCNDSSLLYNAAVASECMAWNVAHDQKTQVKHLKQAKELYRRAAVLRPDDQEIQAAMGEVAYELDTFFASFERQKGTREKLDTYKTPKGF